MDDAQFNSLSKPQQDTVIKIAAEAERQGVRPELAIATAYAESKFSHAGDRGVTTSPAGALGVMQIMPATAELFSKKYGVNIDPNDEDSNIMGGVTILKDLLTQYKSPRIAVALYNASPKAVATFIKTYETDPDKAILSLPEETQKYSLRIGTDPVANFNLDDNKETGLINQGPFAGYVSEASKMRNDTPEAAAPADKPGGLSDEETGALVGAATNLLGPMLTSPKTESRIDPARAQERQLETADRLEMAKRDMQSRFPQGTQDLEASFRQGQQDLARLGDEQRLAQQQLKALPKGIQSAPDVSGAPEVMPRTRTGDSGAVNWVRSMSDGVPEVVANQALNMRKDNPQGGQAIIDADMLARKRQSSLGLGDYTLARTAGGTELALPPTTVAEREADIAKQSAAHEAELQSKASAAQEQQRVQQQALDQQRMSHEANLERLRQERTQAGLRQNVLAGETRAAAPLQRAVTSAETSAELAQRRFHRAQQQPSGLGGMMETIGNKSRLGPVTRTGLGGVAGMLGVMSYQDAVKAFEAGDRSEGVMKALQAGSAAAMVVPPVGRALTRLRGAGAAGLGLTTLYDFGKRMLKDRPPEEQGSE